MTATLSQISIGPALTEQQARELRPYLEAVRAEAEKAAKFVITSYRNAKTNLRTRFERIIQRAGLTPWPRLFQNLRSLRETELNDRFPLQVVVAWIGNSEIVARKNYLQVTEAHYARGNSEPCNDTQKALQPRPNRLVWTRQSDRAEFLIARRSKRLRNGAGALEYVEWAIQDSNL